MLLTLDWPTLVTAVREVRWNYVIVALILSIAGVAIRGVRWLVLLRGLGIDVPLRRLIKLYFVGTFFNAFLPTGLGGDAVRIVELARHNARTPEAAGTVLVDRASGLWTMFVMGLIALPFGARAIPPQMALLVAVVGIGVVAGGWLAMGTPLVLWLGRRVRLPGQAKLERFYRAVSGCGYCALAQACGVSLIFSTMTIAVNFLLARSLNVDLPLGTFFVYSPILAMALLVPSVGGLGVGEAVYSLMYGTVDVPQELATAMSLARYVSQTVVPGLIGGILYLIDGAMGLRQRTDL
ncbi:MAG: flippase-like domain-containing protein [Anaerolineae bacterium]|nr:flippase-like domain-containing protein [Anaerolineae bacterium]